MYVHVGYDEVKAQKSDKLSIESKQVEYSYVKQTSGLRQTNKTPNGVCTTRKLSMKKSKMGV